MGCDNFFDVTLVNDDLQQIEAHKAVLSSCSPVFKELLKSNKHSHHMLYIKGTKEVELKYVLDFIYSGEVSIFQKHLNAFLAIATDLKLKGLSNEESNHNREEKPNIQEGFTKQLKNMDLYNPATEEIITNDLELLEETNALFEEAKNEEFYTVEGNSIDEYEHTVNSMIETIDNRWHCKVCGKEYNSNHKSGLKEHVERKHTSGFTHTCGICGISCSSKTTLRLHKSNYHRTSK